MHALFAHTTVYMEKYGFDNAENFECKSLLAQSTREGTQMGYS